MLKNISKPAPKWFRKTQRVVGIAQDTIIVIMLAMGYSEQSLLMLIIRIGVSNLLKMVEAILKEDDGEPEAEPSNENQPA